MKQYIFRLLPLATILLTACTIEVIDENSDVGGLVPINLTVGVDEPEEWQHTAAGTRAATTLLNNAFAENDQIVVGFSGNTTLGSNTTKYQVTNASTGATSLVSGQTQPYFTLDGSSTTAYGYYPSKPGSTFSVQTAQNTDANYKSSDLMYASVDITKSNGAGSGTLTFSHKMAKIIVSATATSGVSQIKDVRIIGGSRTIDVTNITNCTLGTTLTDANSTSSYITMYSGGTATTASCAALIPPQTVSGNFLQIVTDKGTVTYSLSNKAFATAQSYTFNITINAAAIGTTVAITGWTGTGNVTVQPTETNAPANAVAVDLGLSVKWANMNVGAEKVTDYGTFFAWGETDGITVSGATTTISGTPAKTYFSWDTYAWCKGTYNTLTKYCPTDMQGSYWWDTSGTTVAADNKTQLELGDDAARANWGGKWRMPTAAELAELYRTNPDYDPDYDYSDAGSNTKIDGYTWTWCDGSATQYMGSSVAGYIITKTSSGAHIFLPAAGRRYGASFSSRGSYGFYWSSTLNAGYPDDAWYLYFNSSNAYMYGLDRDFGYTVRAVQSN